MKKVLLMCCVLVGLSTLSHAQGRQRQTPEQQTAALKTSLALNDDQSAKVLSIYTSAAKSNDSLRTAANGDRDAMMKGMMTMRTSTNAKIKAVLTPDQAATFQKGVDAQAERMKQMMNGGGGMGGGGGTPPPPQR